MQSNTLGIDVGGTKIQAGVINAKGRLISRAKMPTHSSENAKIIINRIFECGKKAILKSGIGIESIKCAGIGTAGLIDSKKGVVVSAPNLANFKNTNLKKPLEKLFGFPVFIENDVNCGALGEFHYGVAKKYSSGISLFIGTGIGGAIINDKKLYTGKNGVAGELGHIVIDINSNTVCPCGNKGCFENLASRKALANKIIMLSKKKKNTIIKELTKNYTLELKSSLLKKAFIKKDKITLSAVKEEAHILGIGCANYINIFNPEVIVLGGGLMEAIGKYIIKDIRRSAKKYAFEIGYKNCDIVIDENSDISVIRGASVAALSELSI